VDGPPGYDLLAGPHLLQRGSSANGILDGEFMYHSPHSNGLAPLDGYAAAGVATAGEACRSPGGRVELAAAAAAEGEQLVLSPLTGGQAAPGTLWQRRQQPAGEVGSGVGARLGDGGAAPAGVRAKCE
jgi:hypothetical protein